jgi:hypothetical protein
MKMPLAALHESAIGPTQTSGDVRYRIALGGQADINRPSQFMSTRPSTTLADFERHGIPKSVFL